MVHRVMVNLHGQEGDHLSVFRHIDPVRAFAPEPVQVSVSVAFHVIRVIDRPQHFQKQFPDLSFICRNSGSDLIFHLSPQSLRSL